MRPLSSHHTLQSGYKECYPSTKESYADLVRGDPSVQKSVKPPIPIVDQNLIKQQQSKVLLKGG
jgi:hypothetical protein